MESKEPMEPMDIRIQKGKAFIEHYWRSLASRIVKIAGEHYKWDDDQWRDAMELFLRPGDYIVKVK